MIALYVLYKDEELELWEDFKTLNKKLTKEKLNCHSLRCKKIENTAIEGEPKFNSFVSLYMDKSFSHYAQDKLSKTILSYADNLSSVLGVDIKYQRNLLK